MRKNNKLILLLASALLMLWAVAVGKTSSFAADKEYAINNASFVANINEDGSVDITEVWELDYQQGSFTRFYKDFYTKDLPTEEKMDIDISKLMVAIDGNVCSFTNDTQGRPDYTYNLSDSDVGYTLSCYCRSEKITRTYVISYTLNNAVKYVDGSYYLFTYRFVGANFEKLQKNINVTINTPNGATNEVRYASNNATHSSRDNVSIINSKNNSGMFKIKVRIDGILINNAVAITDADLNNNDSEDADHTKGIVTTVILGFVALISAAIANSSIKTNAIRKELDRNPMYVKEIIANWSKKLAPFEFTFGSVYADDRVLFTLLFSYMKDHGMISMNENHELALHIEGLGYDLEQMMEEFIRGQAALDDGSLYDNVLSENIENNYKEYANFSQELALHIRNSVKKKLSSAEMKEYKKDWDKCRSAVKLLKVQYEAMTEITGNAYSEDTLFYAMVSGKLVFDCEEKTSDYSDWYISDLNDVCYNAYDSYKADNSSSSGSGCSSCSSCSSCGGGGAD